MLSLSTVQTRLAAITSLPGCLPGRRGDVAVAGLWIASIAVASAMVFWLTGVAWLAFAAGLTGMVLAAWRMVKMQARWRDALAEAERQRAVMEQALCESQKMEALGRLTVGVAHDFNNHLTVISTNVEMVSRRLDGSQDRLRRHTDAAMQGIRRAAALTSRLLSFSRQPVPEPETVDVDRLLTGLSDLLRRTLGDRIGLEVQLSGEPWITWADVHQMENALLSLTVNARDRVADGDVLTVTVSNVSVDEIFVAANPRMLPGDYIQVAVGGSVTPADPARWHALDEVTRADLYMARAFVRDVGGCLLQSGASSLRIFLPRYVAPAVMASVPRSNANERPTILVVEDDAPVRAACVEALRELNYQVLEAPDAMDAFRLLADHGGIDLLFTDLGLPSGVSGRALADAARNLDPGIRILFTTGSEYADVPGRPGAALLRKPFSPGQLAAKVHDVLTTGRSAARSETVRG
jgi:CheY-like chemotaxis protein